MFFTPISAFAGAALPVKIAFASLVLGAPFLFSGVIFARAFAGAAHPETALGLNIIGAIFGGCLEYLSVVTGVNGLVLLALAVYAASWAVARTNRVPESS
jgi:Na+-driven multidrug efflux pump